MLDNGGLLKGLIYTALQEKISHDFVKTIMKKLAKSTEGLFFYSIRLNFSFQAFPSQTGVSNLMRTP